MSEHADFRLTTSRLILRPLQPSDLEAFAAYRADPEIARYQSWEPYSLAQATEFLAKYGQQPVPAAPGGWVQIGIAERATNKLLGDCALHLHEHEPRIAEIGVTLSAAAQGSGYATEALQALFQYLFTDLQLHRVVAVTDSLNLPTARLLERIGMRREAHFRQNIWFKGAWGDEFQYALLREEWLAQQKSLGH
ncbi:Protein N-acetyltransferase, RimJ/RimL family [Hymenobacter gelipurpurascens]|uniref:Protein N-acetyltransferase, RimJ/RimL family n=1 Tax=Hymenobacter gelipurpurascens TaxID=89968 RepID=A0A212TQT1_9BACT|nr:GNAT family protein [Hymenobacter gelipurpurascens]SNC68365.1 Protein N-acetyltransferase, RimJ/RimL family [Hymenobacter gelipurpurascens]